MGNFGVNNNIADFGNFLALIELVNSVELFKLVLKIVLLINSKQPSSLSRMESQHLGVT